MDDCGGPSAKRNQSDIERQVLHDPPDSWNLKKSNLEKQRVPPYSLVARAGRWKKWGEVDQKTESFAYAQ